MPKLLGGGSVGPRLNFSERTNPPLQGSAVAQHVLGQDSSREECWGLLRQQPFVANHPILKGVRDVAQTFVPLGLHGDGGSVSKKESLYVLTWNSLVGQGASKQTRFVIAVVKKSEMCLDGSTLDGIWKAVAWSLNALADGRWPKWDWEGRPISKPDVPLAGGMKAACLQMRGDWQWLCQVLSGSVCTSPPNALTLLCT